MGDATARVQARNRGLQLGALPVTADTHTLRAVGGFAFRLEHSQGLDLRAREIGDIVAGGLTVLSNTLGFSPSFRLLVLSRADWAHFTPNPVFGMPHCTDGQTLVMAADEPDFWAGARSWVFGPQEGPELKRLESLYGTVEGEIDVRPFNDLMALHELGHIFHRQVPFDFPRPWLRELFANLCQYVAVAVSMPERMPYLISLPQALQRPADAVTYSTLDALDRPVSSLGLGNLIWYQWQLLLSARAIYEREGPAVLRRIFDASLQCCDRPTVDMDLIAWLDRKAGPVTAGIMRTWPNL